VSHGVFFLCPVRCGRPSVAPQKGQRGALDPSGAADAVSGSGDALDGQTGPR
jgi:hypothetical protein